MVESRKNGSASDLATSGEAALPEGQKAEPTDARRQSQETARTTNKKPVKTKTNTSSATPSAEISPAKKAARTRHELAEKRHDEEIIRRFFESGEYPYHTRMRRTAYELQKAALQVELLKVQRWVKETGQRIVILFEGRDAAGKGGTIKRFMEHLNPRGARVVALEKPTEEERGQWYFQRYIKQLPTAGEIVLFDRSWYNRAGVERVMGFCSANEYLEFMRQAPELERMLVRSGIRLFKYWFSVTQERTAPPLCQTQE